jgi:hypothetical protein
MSIVSTLWEGVWWGFPNLSVSQHSELGISRAYPWPTQLSFDSTADAALDRKANVFVKSRFRKFHRLVINNEQPLYRSVLHAHPVLHSCATVSCGTRNKLFQLLLPPTCHCTVSRHRHQFALPIKKRLATLTLRNCLQIISTETSGIQTTKQVWDKPPFYSTLLHVSTCGVNLHINSNYWRYRTITSVGQLTDSTLKRYINTL